MADGLAVLEKELHELDRRREALQGAIDLLRGSKPRQAAPVPKEATPRRNGTRPIIDDARIIDALRKAQVEITANRLRQLANIPESVPSHVFTKRMAELVESGRVVRTGERRGTRYRIA